MALSVIIFFYAGIGLLAAAGSIFISRKLFSAKGQQIFFALFFVAIAGFYLAFTAYFGDQRAWRLETGAVILFSVFGILGLRFPFARRSTGVLPRTSTSGVVNGMRLGSRVPADPNAEAPLPWLIQQRAMKATWCPHFLRRAPKSLFGRRGQNQMSAF